MSFVSVSNVFQSYDNRPILQRVNVEVAEGEFISIVGASGCGNSTFLRMLLAQERPERGEIRIADAEPAREPGLDRGVGDYGAGPASRRPHRSEPSRRRQAHTTTPLDRLDQHQTLRPESRHQPRQLTADRPARARHQHRLLRRTAVQAHAEAGFEVLLTVGIEDFYEGCDL